MMPNQTGPTTTAGRLNSCMNHFRHGGSSERLFIKGENPEAFFTLLENAFSQYQPAFDQDAILVTRSVRANWILMRRERAAEAFEFALYNRKSDPADFAADDLHQMFLFDRYRTTAQRIFTRSLRDLNLIQKMSLENERWQLHFELQKRTIVEDPATAAFLEDLENLKKEVIVEEEVIGEPPQPFEPQPGPHIPQAIYAAFDDTGATIALEASPKNETVRSLIENAPQHPTPPTHVVRTYHIKGPIPAEWAFLITNNQQRALKYQEIRKPLTFEEWSTLTTTE